MPSIYRERVSSGWVILLLLLPTLAFLMLFLYQLFVRPIGGNPAPNWFLILMFLLFAIVMTNFRELRIEIEESGIKVGYGWIAYRIKWEEIEDIRLDETSNLRYGGYGIRIAKVNDRLRLVYNTIGTPRVVVKKRSGRFKDFVFSTRDPHKIIKIVKSRLVS